MVHAVVTVAADSPDDLATKAGALDVLDGSVGARSQVVGATTLPRPLEGHEHFGFKDGISQPGVQGFHEPEPGRLNQRKGHPGTELVPAGEFVLGQPAQGGPPKPSPLWMHDGSFHVIRRLAQDVLAWRAAAAGFLTPPNPESVGAAMVGRHADGTPLAHPAADSGNLGADRNDFDFGDDQVGQFTPCGAHIRKTNPRSSVPTGPRLARRGIAYGPPFDTQPNADRGLMFVCYCTSIERQFEFIQQSWANSPGFASGGNGPTGVDLVIGPGGTWQAATADVHGTTMFARFVTAKGALYAFTPSLGTLRLLAENQPLPRTGP